MNRQRGWILLSLGVVLALCTGIAVFFLLRQQQAAAIERAETIAAQQAAPVATLELPVAARPLTPGTMLTAEDFQLKEFPLDLVPVAAITSSLTLESAVLAEPVGQGETFSPRQIAGESADRVSRRLPAGRVLSAFPVGDLLNQVRVIEPGDRIDLLITLPVAEVGGPVTAFTLQNIEVFAIVRPGAPEEENPPVALLLSVTPEEAVLLKHVKDSEGTLDFVLRSVLDTEEFDVPPVDREDLIIRYGLR
jgi:pilus assembly protein CpaB